MIELERQHSSYHLDTPNDENENKNTVSLETIFVSVLKEKIQDSNFVLRLNLTKREIYIIQLFLTQESNMLGNIGKQISAIVKDGKLDSSDIPTIVLLIQDVINLKSVNINNLKITVKDVIDFIENSLLVLLEAGVIQTGNLELCKSVLQSSVALLESTIQLDQSIETTDCTCRFWRWS
jgi:hypothetical protein